MHIVVADRNNLDSTREFLEAPAIAKGLIHINRKIAEVQL